jgi:lipoprotein NlpI
VRIFRLCLLLLFVCSGAQAAGYDDFSQGVSATMRNETDLVITFMTRALDEGGLTTHMQTLAHLERGAAHLVKKQCREAVDDLTAALALDAKTPRAHMIRGSANVCLGNSEAALADYTQSLNDQPTASGYLTRGHLYWNLGRFAEAADDFRQAASLAPTYGYALLWIKISAVRAKTDNAEEFARAVKDAKSDWPRPLLDFFAGGAARDSVTKAALEGTETDRRNRQCEANFYLGEWDLIQGQTEDAKPLLKAASDNCPKDFIEFRAANTELARLK